MQGDAYQQVVRWFGRIEVRLGRPVCSIELVHRKGGLAPYAIFPHRTTHVGCRPARASFYNKQQQRPQQGRIDIVTRASRASRLHPSSIIQQQHPPAPSIAIRHRSSSTESTESWFTSSFSSFTNVGGPATYPSRGDAIRRERHDATIEEDQALPGFVDSRGARPDPSATRTLALSVVAGLFLCPSGNASTDVDQPEARCGALAPLEQDRSQPQIDGWLDRNERDALAGISNGSGEQRC